jgi:hypothetical protein
MNCPSCGKASSYGICGILSIAKSQIKIGNNKEVFQTMDLGDLINNCDLVAQREACRLRIPVECAIFCDGLE